MEPDFLHKDEYGRVPSYLEDVKREVEEEREFIEHMIEQQELEESGGEAVGRELSEEERQELLSALRERWNEVNRRYQRMSHQTITTSNSTLGQVRLKEGCERELDELEKDIERLSAKGPIMVVD